MSSPTLAGAWNVDAESSHARFTARTLAGLIKVRGSFRSLNGGFSIDEQGAGGHRQPPRNKRS